MGRSMSDHVPTSATHRNDHIVKRASIESWCGRKHTAKGGVATVRFPPWRSDAKQMNLCPRGHERTLVTYLKTGDEPVANRILRSETEISESVYFDLTSPATSRFGLQSFLPLLAIFQFPNRNGAFGSFPKPAYSFRHLVGRSVHSTCLLAGLCLRSRAGCSCAQRPRK
jgi:hypothetical protein